VRSLSRNEDILLSATGAVEQWRGRFADRIDVHRGFARISEFEMGRVRFLHDGACQDCWVWTRRRPSACLLHTAAEGMDSHIVALRRDYADPRVIIVGAGPAGTRARLPSRCWSAPIVIDESSRSGGQIYRRPRRILHAATAALWHRGSQGARDPRDSLMHWRQSRLSAEPSRGRYRMTAFCPQEMCCRTDPL
jgi:hypothetical protein